MNCGALIVTTLLTVGIGVACGGSERVPEPAAAATPDSQNYLDEGNAHSRSGDYKKAVDAFGRGFRLNLDDAYYTRDVEYYDLVQYNPAIEDFSEAVGLNPEFAQAYYARGLSYVALGKTNESERDLEKAAALGYVP